MRPDRLQQTGLKQCVVTNENVCWLLLKLASLAAAKATPRGPSLRNRTCYEQLVALLVDKQLHS